MPRKKMWVEWDDGADLSQSQKKPGDLSPLTRDGDNHLGQVTLRDIDEDEEEDDWQTDPEPSDPSAEEQSELEELVGALVVLGVIAAAQKAAPHVKRWWNEQAFPFLEKSRVRLSKRRRARGQVATTEKPTMAQLAPTESSQDVVAAFEAYRASMSSAEARERFVAALVARLFSEEQLRMLRNARIEDEGSALELASAVEMLTPQQLGASITLLLEANPSWPDEETLAALERILGSRGEDGERTPARRADQQSLPPPHIAE